MRRLGRLPLIISPSDAPHCAGLIMPRSIKFREPLESTMTFLMRGKIFSIASSYSRFSVTCFAWLYSATSLATRSDSPWASFIRRSRKLSASLMDLSASPRAFASTSFA